MTVNWGKKGKRLSRWYAKEDSEHLMCMFGIEKINPTEKHARAILR